MANTKFIQEFPPNPAAPDYPTRLNVYLERQFRNINQVLAEQTDALNILVEDLRARGVID